MIPARVHHCFGWRDSVIPEHFEENRLSWHKMFPKISLEYWDPARFEGILPAFKERCPFFEDWITAYRKHDSWIRQADMSRVVIIYMEGGFYSDYDIEVVDKGMDLFGTLQETGIFLQDHLKEWNASDGTNERRVEADLFGACQYDARILRLILLQTRNVLAGVLCPYSPVLTETGPGCFTEWATEEKLLDGISTVATRFYYGKERKTAQPKYICGQKVLSPIFVVRHAGSWWSGKNASKGEAIIKEAKCGRERVVRATLSVDLQDGKVEATMGQNVASDAILIHAKKKRKLLSVESNLALLTSASIVSTPTTDFDLKEYSTKAGVVAALKRGEALRHVLIKIAAVPATMIYDNKREEMFALVTKKPQLRRDAIRTLSDAQGDVTKALRTVWAKKKARNSAMAMKL